MKQYLLAMYQPVGEAPPPEFLEPVMAELGKLTGEMREAGVWVFAAGLHPTAGTVVRDRDGETLLTDGPFTEGKEHLGGFTIIQVEDLDAALGWADRMAKIVSSLAIEVTPIR